MRIHSFTSAKKGSIGFKCVEYGAENQQLLPNISSEETVVSGARWMGIIQNWVMMMSSSANARRKKIKLALKHTIVLLLLISSNPYPAV
jgi:hypothetical protein